MKGVEIESEGEASWVEIDRGQKGFVGWKVVVYDPEPEQALAEALRLHEKLEQRFKSAGALK